MTYCGVLDCWQTAPCIRHTHGHAAKPGGYVFPDAGRAARFSQEGVLLSHNAAQGADKKHAVMFVCIHNAGRSQMAQGFLQHYLGDKAIVCSCGSNPGKEVNEVAVAAMKEKGIDISSAFPKPLVPDRFHLLDRAVTMGCGDVCPCVPNVTIEDWKLEDPRGASIDTVRVIRDQIEERIKALCRELDPTFEQPSN